MSGVLVMTLITLVVMFALTREPDITVRPEKPTREYIQKYPVAGGGYQYILVREYELSVEFITDISYGTK